VRPEQVFRDLAADVIGKAGSRAAVGVSPDGSSRIIGPILSVGSALPRAGPVNALRFPVKAALG
jgi:hypothetical protein